MNNATAALFMMDARGHCTFMNPAAETMTGFRFGEIRDMPLHYAIHHHRPDGTPFPMAECPIDRALPENFDVRAHEDVFIRKDGSFFPVTCAASPIFENGVPVGTVVEVRDVSEERRTQRAILEGSARARFVAEAMPQKVWTAAPDGSIDYVNQRSLDYAGLASEEMLDWGWKQIIHPDDWEENLRAWQHSVATGDDFQLEHRFRRADGEYRWHLSRGIARRDEGGAIIMWVGTNTDIDDQKRAAEDRQRLLTLARTDRERLEQIFTVAPAVMAIYSGPEQVITLVNPSWEQTVGKPNAVGKPFREVFPEFAESGLFGLLDQVYETGESYENPELIVPLERWGSGVLEETAWNMVWLALPAREGQTGRDILVHAVEVTEHVRARREIEAARALAEEANRSKSQFLANMSHELRTPLNAIGGYVDLIEMGIRGPVSQQQESDLKRIKRAQQHLLGLINDVLNYAKLEAGRIKFHIEAVPVYAALADMEALIAPQARGKGIAYRCCAGDTAITVHADREKLQQIVLNLLSNAVKFTDSGGEVEVTWDARDEAVEIHVRDTGLGIPPEKLASVFEPFVQVDVDLTRTAQGTGLGLAISRELARSMDGNLTAASVPGEGSTFTLTLPRSG
jgi:PAS domain S-box-containing protein